MNIRVAVTDHGHLFHAGSFGQVKVGQDDLGKMLLQMVKREEVAAGATHTMTKAGKDAGEQPAHGRIIVDDEEIDLCDRHWLLPPICW
ncbi:MAG TPA: hypothetical protein VGB94_02480 [Acidobacteriaceae bacterium]